MNGIKGLILKDLFVLKKQLGIFSLIILLAALIPGVFSQIYCTVFVALMPMTSLSFDERCKWNQLALAMPYSIRDIVLSKYCLGYLISALLLLFLLLADTVRTVLQHQSFSTESVMLALIMILLANLIMAVNLAISFRFGTEKSRLIQFVLVFLNVFFIMSFAPDSLSVGIHLPLTTVVPMVAALTALVNFFSVKLSIRFLTHSLG